MQLQAVRTKQKAGYPDKYQVEVNSMLLKHKPKSWYGLKLTGTVLSAVLAVQLAGCAREPLNSATDGRTQDKTGTRKMNVAPLFDVGVPKTGTQMALKALSGKESDFKKLGGAVFPIGLSEAEALQIIIRELEQKNIECKPSQKEVTIAKDGKFAEWQFDLELKGTEEPVYIEFMPVYGYDSEAKTKTRDAFGIGVDGSSKGAAEDFRTILLDVEDESSGAVFYDQTELSMFPSAENNVHEEYIKEQIAQFISWLEANGLV